MKRLPHPEDRRAYRICLTERGKELEVELCTIAARVTGRSLAPLTADEHETLRVVLRKLRTCQEMTP